MTLDAQTLAAVVAELAPLAGGRIQKVDLVSERELVLELRCPGRTLRLLISARSGEARIHLVPERPDRELPGGDLQRALRRRLEGRPLIGITADRKTIELDAKDARIAVRLDAPKQVFELLPPSGREVPPPQPVPERFPLSEALAARYATRAPEAAADRLRRELSRALKTKKQKLEKLRANLERDRARLEALKETKKHGELLKTMLGRIPRGAREVKANDWETGEELTIALDPALGPKGNLERLFARAKKAERGGPIVARRLAEAESSLAQLAAREAEIAAADHARLLELAEGAQDTRGRAAGGLEPVTAAGAAKKSPIDRWARRFVALDGTEIRVGKGAKENDRLTLSAARGDDLWLHASGTSGAHVLIRVDKGREPSQDALYDAAHLAAHYSGAAAEAKVEIVYTEARYVKKHKGDPPGRVSVARPRTLYITVDRARLDRLFGRTA